MQVRCEEKHFDYSKLNLAGQERIGPGDRSVCPGHRPAGRHRGVLPPLQVKAGRVGSGGDDDGDGRSLEGLARVEERVEGTLQEQVLTGAGNLLNEGLANTIY